MKVQRSITTIDHGNTFNHDFSIEGIPDSQTISVLIYAEVGTGSAATSANVLWGRMHTNAPWRIISSLGAGAAVLQTTTNPYPFIRVSVTSNSGVGTNCISKVAIF